MNRKVYLVGDLAEKFGSSFNVEASTYQEILRCLDANHPTFKRYLLEAKQNGIAFTMETAGTPLECEEDLLLPIKDGDVTFAAVPAGSGGDVLRVVAGVALFFAAGPIGLALAGSSGTLLGVSAATLGTAIGTLGTNLALQGLQGILSPDPGVDDAATDYLFNGSSQNITEGDPVPLLYGELRVPGRPVSLLLNVVNPPEDVGTDTGYEDIHGNKTPGRFYGESQDITVTDLICEGPIFGLTNGLPSIFLNDDRAQDLSFRDELVSTGPKRVRLVAGSTSAVMQNSNTFGAYTTRSNGHHLLIKNGFGTTTVTSIEAPLSITNTRNFTLTASSTFFNSAMIQSTTDQLLDIAGSPARLIDSEGNIFTGNLISVSSNGLTAQFTPSEWGIPMDNISPEGSFTIEIDRVLSYVNISSTQTTATLQSAWTAVNNASTKDYEFDVYSAIGTRVRAARSSRQSRSFVTGTYDGFSAQFRNGNVMQAPFEGFSGSGVQAIPGGTIGSPSLEQSVNFGGDAQPTEIIGVSSSSGFALSLEQAQQADEIRFGISYSGGLYSQHKEKRKTFSNMAFYKISLAVQRPGASSFETPVVLVAEREHFGDQKDAFIVEEVISLARFKPFINFKVIVERITELDGGRYKSVDRRGSNINIADSQIQSLTTIIKEPLTYPYTALAQVAFNSEQFKSLPSRSYHLKGLLVKVPSNYVTRDEGGGEAKYTRNSSGEVTNTYQSWDGTFRTRKVYTNNPAWVFYDILLNNRYGLGSFLKDAQIDKYSLYRIARYCDELVPNGTGGTEPRFTANLFLAKPMDSYKVIKDMATIFRSMVYWMDGQVFPVVDQDKEPVYNFSKSNVIDGILSYESTGSKTRANQVVVAWNNPDANYSLESLIVEDKRDIIETGKIITEQAVAFGCTSEGQALRYGRWKLWTSINQTEVVNFSTSINAAFLTPGDIVNIQDADRNAVRFSGRISSANTPTQSSFTLDAPINLVANRTYEIGVLIVSPSAFLAQSSASIGGVTYSRGDLIPSVTTETAASNLVDSAGNAVEVTWSKHTRVETATISNTIPSTNVTNITVNNFESFTSAPEEGAVWVVTEKDTHGNLFEGSPKKYKILGITQTSETQQAITAVEYFDSKFDSVDYTFSAYANEVLVPAVRATDIVPPPVNLKAIFEEATLLEGEDFRVEWNHPAALVQGERYEFLAGYEVVHNVDGVLSPITLPAEANSYTIKGAPEGDYTIMVRTLNTLENRSIGETVGIAVLNKFESESPRFPLGVPYGGSSNAGFSIDENGLFRIGSQDNGWNYILTPANSSAPLFTNTQIAPDTLYTQDCSGLSNITSPTTGTDISFNKDHWYILLDRSSTADRIKLIKYDETTYPDPYWFDAGNGSDTSGLITLTGTITRAAGSSTIIGTNTDFVNQCKEGEVFKAANHNEICRVVSINSATELTIDKAFSTAWTSQGCETSNIFIDYDNDTIIAKVYKTNPYVLLPLVDIVAEAGDANETISPGTITDTELGNDTISGPSIRTDAITNAHIATDTIRGDNIHANTRIAVYQKDVAGEIIDSSFAALDGSNDLWRIYAGSESPQIAPFRVTDNGMVVAKNLQLYRNDGTIYFDSYSGFSQNALAQIAGATKSRVYHLTSTLTGDLVPTTANTYQKLDVIDSTNITLDMRIPVDNFSKYLSEVYYGVNTTNSSVGMTIYAYNAGASYNRTHLQATTDNGATFSSFSRPLKGGEIVRILIDGALPNLTSVADITGATQIDGTSFASSFNLSHKTQLVSFKVVAGQEFGFKIKKSGEADIVFKAGHSGAGGSYYDRSAPLSYVEDNLDTGVQTWYYQGTSLGTTSAGTNTITVGGVQYTRGIYKTTEAGYSNSQSSVAVYYSIVGASSSAVTENTAAIPDLTTNALGYIPTSIKARLFQRTSPTDTSPTTLIDHWSSNNFTRVTSGTPTASQYRVTSNLDNSISDSIIEADVSIDIPRTGTFGAVDGEGYITTSTTVSLSPGVYYFDIELEFTGGGSPAVEGARILVANAPTTSRGFKLIDEGGSTDLFDGDITSVIAGDGLSGGGIKGDVTLDVDSTVVRTSGNQTISGDKWFKGDILIDSNVYNSDAEFTIKANSPTISLLDRDINKNDFYISVDSDKFFVLVNRTDSEIDTVGGDWETEHPLELDSSTDEGLLFGSRIYTDSYKPVADTVETGSSSSASDQFITFVPTNNSTRAGSLLNTHSAVKYNANTATLSATNLVSTTVDASGNIDANSYSVNGTEVLDSGRNLKNIQGLDITLDITINNQPLVDANGKITARGGIEDASGNTVVDTSGNITSAGTATTGGVTTTNADGSSSTAGSTQTGPSGLTVTGSSTTSASGTVTSQPGATLGSAGLGLDGNTIITSSGDITCGTIDATGDIETAGKVIANGGDSDQWNTAYGWGDHSAAGYLSAFTETDPVFTAHVANGITAAQITSWDTAASATETDSIVGAVTGLVKADGNGNISAATAGTDYIATESDPVFTAHAASNVTAAYIAAWNNAAAIVDTSGGLNLTASITIDNTTFVDSNGNITCGTIDATGDIETAGKVLAGSGDSDDWNTAFGWGDHSAAGYLTTETDPVFTAHAASGVTSAKITNWDTAYGWGDHSAAGYLTTESDPVFTAHAASGVTATKITNWDTAYGWGDHSLVGYSTTDTTYSPATSNTYGLVRIGYAESGKNYPVELSGGRMYVNVPWTDTITTDTNTTYSQATTNTYGLIRVGYSENAQNYPVELSAGRAYVNVPWVDTDTTYSTATASVEGLVKIGFTEDGKNYPVELANGKMYVNVPWVDTDTDTTYTTATSSDLGLIKVGHATDLGNKRYGIHLATNGQAYVDVPWAGATTAATSSSLGLLKIGYTESGKNYPVELDANSQAFVNVPWVDTDTDTTYSEATSSDLGLIKVGHTQDLANKRYAVRLSNLGHAYVDVPWSGSTTAATSSSLGLLKIGYTESGKNYPVELDGSNKAFVNVPWVDTDTDTTYSTATSSAEGLIKIGYTESGKNYPVELDGSNKAFVNVPWIDTNTTYSEANSSTYGLVKTGYSENGKNYPVELSSGKMYVNVPWVDTNTDTNTTYAQANSSTLGLVKIGYAENGRNYPVELSSGKMYVNVPWVDTNTVTTSMVKGHVTYNPSTAAVLASGGGLTVVKNETGKWTITIPSTISGGRPSTNTGYSILVGGVSDKTYLLAANIYGNDSSSVQYIKDYNAWVDSQTTTSFVIRATRATNDYTHFGGNDNNDAPIHGITSVNPNTPITVTILY